MGMKMLMLITYDISLEDAEGQARLRRVQIVFGLRRARAVFCVRMRHRTRSVGRFKGQTFENLQPRNRQLALFTIWAANGGTKWEHHGAKPAVDVFKDTLIV